MGKKAMKKGEQTTAGYKSEKDSESKVCNFSRVFSQAIKPGIPPLKSVLVIITFSGRVAVLILLCYLNSQHVLQNLTHLYVVLAKGSSLDCRKGGIKECPCPCGGNGGQHGL